jgi:hypothetical protein
MIRKNLGLGMGRGYKNLIPIDHHIHSLSAKGVKSYKNWRVVKGFMNAKSFKKRYYPLVEKELRKPIYDFDAKKRYYETKSFYCRNCDKDMDFELHEGAEAYNPEKEAFWYECPKCHYVIDEGDLSQMEEDAEAERQMEQEREKKHHLSAKGIKENKLYLIRHTISDDGDEIFFEIVKSLKEKINTPEVSNKYRFYHKENGNLTEEYVATEKEVSDMIKSGDIQLNAKNIYRQHASGGFDSSEIDKEVERLKKEAVKRRKLIMEGKLNGKHFKSRIMWNPRTKKMISGDTTHDAILEQHLKKVNPHPNYINKNLNKFNEWVRGLYDEENKTLYVRQYFNPQSLYSEFTAKDFEISEKMQKKFVEQLHLPKDVKVVYNATNESLRQEGYIHS